MLFLFLKCISGLSGLDLHSTRLVSSSCFPFWEGFSIAFVEQTKSRFVGLPSSRLCRRFASLITLCWGLAFRVSSKAVGLPRSMSLHWSDYDAWWRLRLPRRIFPPAVLQLMHSLAGSYVIVLGCAVHSLVIAAHRNRADLLCSTCFHFRPAPPSRTDTPASWRKTRAVRESRTRRTRLVTHHDIQNNPSALTLTCLTSREEISSTSRLIQRRKRFA